MNLVILFLISVGLLGFGLESYAIEFTDSTGHIPDWAINAEQDQVISKCESGDYSEKDADWCLEYLESLLVELKNDPIIQEIEADIGIPDPEPTVSETVSINIEENTCPDGEEWIESAGICMTPMPVMDEELTNVPTCGKGTTIQDGICVIESKFENESQGGGCLIATATYGTELAPQVQHLRDIRDNNLLQTESGTSFMSTFNDLYYSFSPTIADWERESPVFKEIVKIGITPMITTLSLMDYAETESEVLGIGISLIILNLGMYVGVPVVAIIGIRRF